MHSGMYTAYENGTFVLGEVFSTSRNCKNNFDTVYIDALKKSNNFIRQGKDVLLRNGNSLLVKLVWQDANKVEEKG